MALADSLRFQKPTNAKPETVGSNPKTTADRMVLILTVIAAAMFLTAGGTVYYAFFRQPNKLKKLNTDIHALSSNKDNLSQTVDTLTKNKTSLEQTYSKLRTDTDKLNIEWNNLSKLISSGQEEIKQIGKDKAKIQADIQRLKTEIEKLKTAFTDSSNKFAETQTQLTTLTDKKNTLQTSVNTIQSAVNKLQKETADLQQRKFDLEEENSHLSREIVKKKISCRAVNETPVIVKQYDDEQGHNCTVKHIGYSPNNLFSKECFPLVLMPQKNSVIKFPRKGRLGQRGYTEPFFEEHLKTYFFRQRNMQFFNDRFLFVSNNTRPYEPDFTLIDERENLNLFIDIEIDEPYDGVERYAMHYKGCEDDFRNQYFTDRGWMVIRFSERQVHLNPLGCCRFISEVIKSVNPKFSIPQDLQNVPTVQEEPFWTKVKAESWVRENYRENYLRTTFSAKPKVIIVTDNLKENETEKSIESLLQTTISYQEENTFGRWWNKRNEHVRDKRIKFYPEPHLYVIDGSKSYTSATTLIYKFFESFPEENFDEERRARWRIENRRAAEDGMQLHIDIEDYLEAGNEKDKKEFRHFLNFYENHLGRPIPYRTEWRIFDDIHYIAGTADLILKKSDGTYAIYDWKRSKNIKRNGFADYFEGTTQKGIGICSNIEHANFYHYCIQLNIYKKILESFYDKQVTEMYFVQLHPNFDDFNIFEVKDMQTTVDKMFEVIQ